MTKSINLKDYLLSKSWLFLTIIILCLGIFFRLAYLGEKIYWVDEVSTSMRVNGYYKQEVIAQLSRQSIITVADLQKYQKVSPDKNWSDTLKALKTSPEHAPLYFMLASFWVKFWGNSIITVRSLSVVFSLISLFCIYWLSQELFNSNYAAIISVLLMAISPFYVAYAQEARPYSLWTVTILISSIMLLKATKRNNWFNWFFYSISLTISFYTSLLSILVILGQLLYVLWEKTKIKQTLIAITIAVITFIPWLLVIFNHWQRLEENTTWIQESMDILAMVAVWLYSIAIIFIESPIYLKLDGLMLTRIMIDISLFILVGFSCYFLIIKTKPKVYLFILSLGIIPRLIVIALDLINQQQASTAPRYMIPLYIAIQLTLSYLLATKSFYVFNSIRQRRKWQIILVSVISLGIISCSFNLRESPKYQKTRNIDNLVIAEIINQSENPLILSENKNILDLISLSYNLKSEVKIKLLSAKSLINTTPLANRFLLNPSASLLENITSKYILKQVYQPDLLIPEEIHLSLWKI